MGKIQHSCYHKINIYNDITQTFQNKTMKLLTLVNSRNIMNILNQFFQFSMKTLHTHKQDIWNDRQLHGQTDEWTH